MNCTQTLGSQVVVTSTLASFLFSYWYWPALFTPILDSAASQSAVWNSALV